MKTIKMLKIKENSHEIEYIKMKDFKGDIQQLNEIYKILNINTIDITDIKIGRNWYSAIVDDEGLLKNEVFYSLWRDEEPILAGNILLTKHDQEGNNIGLEDYDFEVIENNLHKIYYKLDPLITEPIYKAFEIK